MLAHQRTALGFEEGISSRTSNPASGVHKTIDRM